MFSRRDFTLKRWTRSAATPRSSSPSSRAWSFATKPSSRTSRTSRKRRSFRNVSFLWWRCCAEPRHLRQIGETLRHSSAECVHPFAARSLKFIELLPGNRVKLLVSRTFAWLPDGRSSASSITRHTASSSARDSTARTNACWWSTGCPRRARAPTLVARLEAVAREFSDPAQRGFATSLGERSR